MRIMPRRNQPKKRKLLKIGSELRDFDFYFDYVIRLVESLKVLWDV